MGSVDQARGVSRAFDFDRVGDVEHIVHPRE
jgi:hypothetical protein